MKTIPTLTKIMVMASFLSGCATSGGAYLLTLAGVGAYGGYWWLTRPTVEKAIDNANTVKQPQKSPLGQSPVATHMGPIATDSYSKTKKEVCLVHTADSSSYRYQLGLVKDKESTKNPLAVQNIFTTQVMDAASRTVSYESTETTKYKDSSGKVIATADRPVTKYATETTYTVKVCFPDVDLNRKDNFYMVVGMDVDKNEELGDNASFAAWHIVR